MLKLNQYSRSWLTLSVLFASCLIVSACSTNIDQTTQLVGEEYEFVSVGYAAMAAQKGDSDDIRMLNAIKASKLEAYKELAEQVYGVMLTSENTLQQHQLQNDSLKAKVSGLVRGARVLRTYHEGDLFVTELGLNMKTLPFLKKAEFTDIEEAVKVQTQIYY